jgi:N-terminal domain of galactosyltransferase
VTPIILVGRRDDNGHRDELWRLCRDRWDDLLGWPIVEGHHDDGPFCLSVASNRAAATAGDWDTAIYVGSDWLTLDAHQIHEAVDVATTTGKMTFAHNQTVILDKKATDVFIDSDGALLDLSEGAWHNNTFSGVFAITRRMWDRVGGFDERFIGWGWDDLAFWAACCATGRGYERIDGIIVHLWHPRSRADNEDQPFHAANQELGQRYLKAKGSRSKMMGILREPGGPLGPKVTA